LNQFAQIYFEEAKKKFPHSIRLFFQYSYFALQSCTNRFMTENLLRNFRQRGGGGSERSFKVNWAERISIQINEL